MQWLCVLLTISFSMLFHCVLLLFNTRICDNRALPPSCDVPGGVHSVWPMLLLNVVCFLLDGCVWAFTALSVGMDLGHVCSWSRPSSWIWSLFSLFGPNILVRFRRLWPRRHLFALNCGSSRFISHAVYGAKPLSHPFITDGASSRSVPLERPGLLPFFLFASMCFSMVTLYFDHVCFRMCLDCRCWVWVAPFLLSSRRLFYSL
ncbi:hypothetical protein BKA70DRAFT_72714 [Coprinopsis sp. MPI-PUGE-AT-0042]|nr:hypothetical protein BKA70DRAFT_98345 [Coprinopsis sp. MPI-PUGE-AT-0042]KAH6887322.1 hypothetical protein BKA70DRAFT_72714 [Coprinopsis sp. MPI-PUGE-AT-0042]